MRSKYSCYLKIITLKGTMADIEREANKFAKLATVIGADFKVLDQSPAEQASAQISQSQKETWAAFLNERRLLDSHCQEPPFNTLQFKLLATKTDNLDELAPMVNAFADTHEVTKIDVAAKRQPRGKIWVAQVSYGGLIG